MKMNKLVLSAGGAFSIPSDSCMVCSFLHQDAPQNYSMFYSQFHSIKFHGFACNIVLCILKNILWNMKLL